VTRAAVEHPSLLDKRVSPHTLRHYLPSLTMSRSSTTAVCLLGIRGID
jgi:hypothetical protein